MTPPVWSATTGEGAAHVVLIHGSLDRSTGMLRLARQLDQRYRVTRFDRRGYGRSAPHPGPFGVDQQVDDLLNLIEREATTDTPLVLFGHSYGGNVALAAAERNPGRFAGVAVYEPPLAWHPWWPVRHARDAVAERPPEPAVAAERFMRSLIGDERWERLPPATQEARRAEGPALMGELNDLVRRPPWTGEGITLPVVAMHGERGEDRHRRGVAEIAEAFGGEVVTITDAGHTGPHTHAPAVAAVVSAFVERCVSSVAGG